MLGTEEKMPADVTSAGASQALGGFVEKLLGAPQRLANGGCRQ
jgi:hypothetical protein